MIEKLSKVSEGFFALLTQNNIRGYATEIEFSNLGQPMSSKAKFSQMDCKTGTIAIELKNEGDKITLPEDAFIYANIKKPNGEIVTNPVEIISHEDGAVLLQLKSQSINIVGISTFEIVIKFGEEAKLISPKLTFEVFESYDTANNIFAEDQQTVLDKLVSDTEAKLNETEQKLTEVQEALNGVDDLAQEMRESTQENTQKIDQSIVKNTENINTAIDENTRRIDSAIEEGTGRLSESISENTQKIETAILQNVEKINSAITENVNRVNSTIDENVEKINLAISNNTKAMEDAIADGSSKINTAISENTGRVDAALSDLEAQVDEGRAVDTKLESTINAAKDFIGSLEENQDFIDMKNDISDMKNGLKSNQLLAYEGTNITCENTFDGRTEDLIIKGRTFQNIIDKFGTIIITPTGGSASSTSWCKLLKPNTQYTAIVLNKGPIDRWYLSDHDVNKYFQNVTTDINTFTTPETITDRIKFGCFPATGSTFLDVDLSKVRVLLFEGVHTKESAPNFYFEGIQSAGDKSKNLFNKNTCKKDFGLVWATGLENPEVGSIASDYIELPQGANMLVCNYIWQCMWYDKNKNYLGNGPNCDNGANSVKKIIVPNRNDIAYFRAGIRPANNSFEIDVDKIQVELNNETSYEPHYEGHKINALSYSNLVNMTSSFKPVPNVQTRSDFYDCYIPAGSDFTFGVYSENQLSTVTTIEVDFFDENKIRIDFWTCIGKLRYIDKTKAFKKDVHYVALRNSSINISEKTIDGIKIVLGNVTDTTLTKYGINKKEILLQTNGAIIHPKLTQGSINGMTGELLESNSRVRTDYLECGNVVSAYNSTRTYVVFFDENKKRLSNVEWQISLMDYKVPTGAKYMILTFAKQDDSTCTPSDFVNIKVLVKGIRPKEDGLNGLPSGVYDSIEQREDGVYLIQKVGKVILDGSDDENWVDRTNGVTSDGVNMIFSSDKAVINYLKNKATTMLSDKLICNKSDGYVDSYNNYKGCLSYYVNESVVGNIIYIVLDKAKLPTQDVAGFKAWLKTNQVTVYYELAEPIETKLDIPSLHLETFRDVTHVMGLNQIPAILDFKIPSNIGSILQQNSKNINELYKLIDELVLPQLVENSSRIAEMKYREQESSRNDL